MKKKEMVFSEDFKGKKRLELYDSMAETRKKKYPHIYVDEKTFHDAVKLLAKWDRTFGKKHERLMKTFYTREDISNFLEKAEPLYKQLRKAFGTKLCKSPGCLGIISPDSNPRREYCNNECRHRTHAAAWRAANPEKNLANIQNFFHRRQLKKDNVPEKLYDTTKNYVKEKRIP